MKKNSFISAIVMAAFVSIISCNKAVVTSPSINQEEGTIELTITAGSPNTKTAFGINSGSGYPVTWSAEGEAIKLIEILDPSEGDASYKAYTSKGYSLSDGNATAVFSAEVNALSTEGTYDYRAVYPSSAYNSANLQYSDIYVTIPNSQTPTVSSPDAAATILYAESEGYSSQPTAALNLSFSHITAYGKMTVKDASDAFADPSEVISSISVSVPSGGLYYYWSDGHTSAVPATKHDNVSISTSNLDTSGDFVVWFACAPYSLSASDELTVSVTTGANTYSRTITLAKALAFESGKVSTFTVDMSSAKGADDLSGDYIIVSTDGSAPWHIMTYDASNNYYLGESTEVASSTVLATDNASTNFGSFCVDTYVWTLAKVSGGYSLKNANTGKYVSWTAGNTATAVNDAATLVVEDEGSGVFSVKHGSDESRKLQYNYNTGTNPRFAFYTSAQKDLYFIPVASYKRKLATPVISTSLSGSVITVTWDVVSNASSYTVTCTGQSNRNIPYGTNTTTFSGLADGKYTITVTAVGDGVTYVNSNTANSNPITIGSTGGTDVLNNSWTGVTGTSYVAKTSLAGSVSAAVYSVQCAGGNSSIQLRSSNSNSGIVTTASGGTVTKVVVKWNSNTTSGRTINIYGKKSAYSSPSDLYNTSTQGTLLGTIVKGTSTELSISGDYTHIGIRSSSGALYLDEVKITWE